MNWVEPLSLKEIFIQIFAGSGTYFGIISLFLITSMAGYFRMNGISMAFMIGVFLLMFSEYIPASLMIFITIIAGLLVGYSVSRIVKN